MTEVEVKYPKFYRKGTLCLKRESDTQAVEVKIPLPAKLMPISTDRIVFPDKERLDEVVASMEHVDQEVYDSYLAMFFQTAEQIRVKFNEKRQAQYEQNQTKRV